MNFDSSTPFRMLLNAHVPLPNTRDLFQFATGAFSNRKYLRGYFWF